jgi:hypothetical protein
LLITLSRQQLRAAEKTRKDVRGQAGLGRSYAPR